MCTHWHSVILIEGHVKEEWFLHWTVCTGNQSFLEVMVGFRYLYRMIHSKEPLVDKPWMSMV